MVAASSTMQNLGSSAYSFELPDVANTNTLVRLADYVDQPVLLMFICNHCPYVIHIIEPLVKIANSAQQQGFAVFAICSNDAQAYPQDSPENMAIFADTYGFEFPYCYDQSQSVAKDYAAACTPDFYIYDRNHQLSYRGQMDASRPGNDVIPNGNELKAALDNVLTGTPVAQQQTASVGCSIKWSPDNQPSLRLRT